MEITNISQLLPFVERKPEFIVIDKGEYQVIDYVYQDQHTFDDPELMECRGIKFDKDGLILARPFRKFFNYGERGADLPVHRPHVITHKLDGSMVHPTLLNRRLFFHTRKGHTDVAKKAERFVLSSPKHNYQSFCIHALQMGWTPIFEYTGPNNRIVLRYEEEALTLLAMRNTVSGHLMDRDGLLGWSRNHKIPLVPVFNMTLIGQVDKFITHTRALKDAEGYVVYFDDGYMVKIKAEDYVLKHRALDDLGSKKKVVAVCAQGFLDDLLPILSEADQRELLEFNDAVQREIGLMLNTVYDLLSVYRLMSETYGESARKRFALNTVARKLGHIKSASFAAIDDKDPRLVLINAVIRNPDLIMTKWRGE